jgi:hypothetical protein
MDNKTLLVLGGLAVVGVTIYLNRKASEPAPVAYEAPAPVTAAPKKKRSRLSKLASIGGKALSLASKTSYGMAVRRSVEGAIKAA